MRWPERAFALVMIAVLAVAVVSALAGCLVAQCSGLAKEVRTEQTDDGTTYQVTTYRCVRN